MRNRFVLGAQVDRDLDGNRAAVNIETNSNGQFLNTYTGGTKDAVVVEHSHTVSETMAGEKVITGLISSGGGGNHHRVSMSGDTNSPSNFYSASNHTHSVSVNTEGEAGTNKNLPPYYALAFIMRVS